jgi:RNA recognition motif-containing protein
LNIYIGNLSREVTETELREAFEAVGEVTSVSIIKDKFTGDSKGFGFVEMAAKAKGQEAISTLNGQELKGRTIVVNEAKPRTESSSNSRGGGGGGNRRW